MNKKQIMQRLIQIIITLFGISIITYALIFLAPGDPVRTMYISGGNIPSEAIIEKTREAMGLNKPFLEQYLNWLGDILQGDFGTSFSLDQPVGEILWKRLIQSLYLALSSILLMLVISIPLGIISAIKANKPIDTIISAYTSLGISMPGFFVGTLLLYLFALKFKLLPVVSVGGGIKMLILPSITLAFAMSAKYTRQVRSIVLDELNKAYVIGARARGIKFRDIIFKDVFINILLPLLTLLGISFGSLLSGVAVVEVIFSYPGIGKMAVDAITAYDYSLIQGYVLLISLLYMSINLLVDISYYFLDPRIKNSL